MFVSVWIALSLFQYPDGYLETQKANSTTSQERLSEEDKETPKKKGKKRKSEGE